MFYFIFVVDNYGYIGILDGDRRYYMFSSVISTINKFTQQYLQKSFTLANDRFKLLSPQEEKFEYIGPYDHIKKGDIIFMDSYPQHVSSDMANLAIN